MEIGEVWQSHLHLKLLKQRTALRASNTTSHKIMRLWLHMHLYLFVSKHKPLSYLCVSHFFSESTVLNEIPELFQPAEGATEENS